MKKPVTLKMIAEQLNISATAVSKALRSDSSIGEETRFKVKTLAKELNYRPNSIAQSLKSNRTKTLGLVISDSSLSFLATMIEEVEKVATERGYSIILCDAYSNLEKEKNAVKTLVNKRIDGLMLAASMLTSPGHRGFLDSFGIPYVFLVRKCEYDDGEYIINDNVSGTMQMIDYLVKTGSRKIHFINISNRITTYKERETGYRKALEKNGIEYDSTIVTNIKPKIEEGYNAMNRLLKKGEKVEAVFCGCDMIAIGVMECIFEHGLRIPEDIRVASYDDIEFAAYLRCPLTTVRQPIEKIGRLGAEMLIEKINAKTEEEQKIAMVLKPELVLRSST